MRLSRKAGYAVRSMLDLALHKGPVTLADISQWQGVSLSYLEQIFARLRKQGLVEGIRGPGGGYRLSRSPDEITVAEIIVTVEGPMIIYQTYGEQPLSKELWQRLSQQVHDYLDTITLGDLIRGSEGLEPSRRRSETAA
ncbi:MAG: Rrf2 family transcriptional regulator [Gammaproteobacteria bacterium]|nr:MAG: Rrf2 family transcriptional regulator [Gammaproteobacteria bacterium]